MYSKGVSYSEVQEGLKNKSEGSVANTFLFVHDLAPAKSRAHSYYSAQSI